MKLILFASIFSFAVAAAVAPVDYGNNNYRPYKGILSQDDAKDITDAFISVLQNQRYNNDPPNKTYKKYLEKKFTERSGAINSLISPTNNVEAAIVTNRDDWYKGVKENPVKSIKRSKIYVAGNVIFWEWAFDEVGSGKYVVDGINVFHISDDKKIAEVNIVLNSLAWGFNTGQVNQYCPACPKCPKFMV